MIFLYLGGVDGNNNFENLNMTVWGQIFYWNGTFILETLVLTSSINRSPKNLRGMMFSNKLENIEVVGLSWTARSLLVYERHATIVWEFLCRTTAGLFLEEFKTFWGGRSYAQAPHCQDVWGGLWVVGVLSSDLCHSGSVRAPRSTELNPILTERQARRQWRELVSLVPSWWKLRCRLLRLAGCEASREPGGRTAILTTAPFWHQDSQSDFASMWLETASSIFKQLR